MKAARLRRCCLAKDPAGRYDTTRDLWRELSTVRHRFSEITSARASSIKRPPAWRRWARDAALLLAGAALGAVAGARWWSSPRPEVRWSGARLGGASVSLNPRISPDGHLLAFVALVNGVTEVGVMEPGSASWTLLTKSGRQGYAQNVSWSHDGSRLYFDRYWGQPVGVYAIPPLGGDPVLILEKAFEPKALPDGSLLLLRLAGSSDQIFRFWPQNGKLQALPAFFDLNDVAAPYCPFADGRQVAYFGRSSADLAQPAALRVLNLDTGATRVLDAAVEISAQGIMSLPLTVTPDGRGIITLEQRGDTYDVIAVNTDGTPGHRVLMTLLSSQLPWFMEAAPDGSLYLDQVGRPTSILHLSVNRNAIEQFPEASVVTRSTLLLSDGRIAVESTAGKRQVVIGTPGSELRPFLQLDEPSGGPLAPAGRDAIGLVVGVNGHRRIAIVSTSDGRVLREVPLSAGDLTGLAVSSDRVIIYYAQNDSVFSLTGSGPPRRLGQGGTVALDPDGRRLYVKQFAYDPIRLVRIDLASGQETQITVPGEVRLTPVNLSATAVDSNQRMLLDTSSPLMWFYRPALLDLRSGSLTRIATSFVGDCLAPGWAADGSIMCQAVGLTGSLWRYRPEGVIER